MRILTSSRKTIFYSGNTNRRFQLTILTFLNTFKGIFLGGIIGRINFTFLTGSLLLNNLKNFIFNPIYNNMSQLDNPCDPPIPPPKIILDPIPPYCRDEPEESLKGEPGEELSWLLKNSEEVRSNGNNALCDPMQKGFIINEQDGLRNPSTVYRYTKALRGCDEAMQDLFRDLVVLDEQGRAHNVPIIWGTQEKAVVAILQQNVRQDNSTVVDRIRLPMLAIHSTGEQFDASRYAYHKAVNYLRDRQGNPSFTIKERVSKDTVFGMAKGIPINKSYTLYAWTLYREDMNQIVEQVVSKFSLLAYIRVRGVSWEIGVKLDEIGNNIEVDPGDQAIQVYKYQFNMTAETYIPQPLIRKKSALNINTEFFDSVDDLSIKKVVDRLEEAVKELQ
jgi:hypothetical protein